MKFFTTGDAIFYLYLVIDKHDDEHVHNESFLPMDCHYDTI